MPEHIVKVLQRTQLSHSQSDAKHFIYIYSKWLEDVTELELLLTTSNTSYKATLKHGEIKSAAEELEQPYDEFFAECKKALITQMGVPGFDYEVDEQQARFKLVKCTGFETLYVDVPLRKASNCYQLLDAAMEMAQRQPTVDAAGNAGQVDAGASQSNELLIEYEQYIKDSKLAEKKLLKKFVMLINSKKQRIEELERRLEERGQNAGHDTDTDIEEQPAEVSVDGEEGDDDDVYAGATQVLTQKNRMQELYSNKMPSTE
ncbi:uncharacterized protein LOC135434672 [Drosophila montana]|uniref:uncharacterized protein LOC135434672 n=1 Tax=Drosophila montana TaxID=40370 RepID=UPI00313D2E0C